MYLHTQTPRIALARQKHFCLEQSSMYSLRAGFLTKINAELKPFPYFARELRARIGGSFDDLVHEPKRGQSGASIHRASERQHVWVNYIVGIPHKVLSAAVLACKQTQRQTDPLKTCLTPASMRVMQAAWWKPPQSSPSTRRSPGTSSEELFPFLLQELSESLVVPEVVEVDVVGDVAALLDVDVVAIGVVVAARSAAAGVVV